MAQAPAPPRDVELTDGRLVLRPARPDDAGPFLEAVTESIPELSRWFPWAHEGYAPSEAEEWMRITMESWDAGRSHELFVFSDGRFLGACGLNDIRERRANCGYWVRTSATRRGVCSAAVRLAARWGFETLGLARIEIVVPVGNTPSERAAVKAGAVREGVLRRRIPIAEPPLDATLFSLIPDDLG